MTSRSMNPPLFSSAWRGEFTMFGPLMMYWNGVMADHVRTIADKTTRCDHTDADEAAFAARMAKFRGKTFVRSPVVTATGANHVIAFKRVARRAGRSGG